MGGETIAVFHRGSCESPGYLTTKKTVQITEIPDTSYTLGRMQGCWLLFLHYPDETRVAEVELDGQGVALHVNEERYAGLSAMLDSNGRLTLENEKVRVEAQLQDDGAYFRGAAFVEGATSPIPCSACRVEQTRGGREQE